MRSRSIDVNYLSVEVASLSVEVNYLSVEVAYLSIQGNYLFVQAAGLSVEVNYLLVEVASLSVEVNYLNRHTQRLIRSNCVGCYGLGASFFLPSFLKRSPNCSASGFKPGVVFAAVVTYL